MDAGAGDSIVLEEEIDPNYEPTEDEVLEYAKWLGMDLDAERDLFWIAREGLKAPLPENWKPCKTTDTGEIYYFNFATGASTWDHPCDEYYRKLYDDHKKKTIQGKKFSDADSKKKKEKDDVDEILGRNKSKKKKSAPKADALAGVKSSLDKKPLGGIPSKLGPASGGLGPLGGLKPVGGLGKSNVKPLGRADSDNDEEKSDEEEEAKVEIKPLKKPLLGSATKAKDELDKKSAALDKELEDLEAAHATKMAALKAKIAEEEESIRETQKANEKKLAKIQENHDDEVNSMKELEKKLSKRRKDMEAENRKQLDELEEGLIEKKRELRQRQDKEIKEIEEKHRTRLDDLLSKHEHALEEMKHKQEIEMEHREKVQLETTNRYQEEIDTLKQDLEKARSTIRELKENAAEADKQYEIKAEEFEAKINQLQEKLREATKVDTPSEADISAELEKVSAKWQQKIDELSVDNEAGRKELQSQLDTALAELAATKKSLEQEKNALAAANDTISLWKQRHEDLSSASKSTSQDQLNEMREKYEQEVDSLKRKYEDLKAEHAAAVVENTKEEDTKMDTSKIEKDIQSKYETLLDEKSSDLKSLQDTCAEWEEKYNKLAQETEEKRKVLLDEHNITMQSNADSATALLSAEKSKLEAAQNELNDLKSSHQDLKTAFESLQKAKFALEKELQTKALSIDASEDANTMWQDKVADLENQLADKEQQNKDANKALEDTKNEFKCAKESYVSEMEKQSKQHQEEKKQLEAQIAHVQSQWTTLQSQESSVSSMITALQEQLKQALDEKSSLHSSLDEQIEETKKASSVYETTIANLKRDAIEMQATHTAALQTALNDMQKVEATKRGLEDQKAALERKLKLKDGEIAALTTQLQSETTTTSAVPAWELEKWTSLAKSLEIEKAELQTRCETQLHELDALTDLRHRLQLEKDQSDKKAKQFEAERDTLNGKLKALQSECDALQSKNRAMTMEVAENKASINKLRMSNQTLDAELQRHKEETSTLESQSKAHKDAAEALEVKLRSLKLQVEDLSFQLSMVQQEKTNLQSEIDNMRAKATTNIKSTAKDSDSSAQWKQQIDNILMEKQQIQDKLRATQQKAQEMESKLKTSVEEFERQLSTLMSERQSLSDKCDKLSKQNQQTELALRRANQEKDDMTDMVQRLTTEKSDVEAKTKQQLESNKSLESKLRDALHQIDVLEDAKQNDSYALQMTENKIKRAEQEIERLKQEVAAQTQANDSIVGKLKAENSALEAKVKALRQEQAESLQRRSADDESQRDQLATQYKRELDETKRDVQAKMQLIEKENENLTQQLHERSKDVQIKQKEIEQLQIAKQKLDVLVNSLHEQARQDKTQAQTDLDAIKARLKAVQSEKDELFLLASANTPAVAADPSISNQEAHMVKLQMAHVNQAELESHLKEVTSQLDTWRRKASMLDLRCRDLALEIEGLHVENATLRSSAQRMHTNAMESLSTIERLNYEHKKRLLRSEYMAQLRDFSEREELALARQKARVRASCERQLEEVVLSFQQQSTQRLEHEEHEFQAALRHCKQDHELQLQRLLKSHHDKLAAYQQDLQDKQTTQMHEMSKQMHMEEAHLAARLRDAHQLNREEELSKVTQLEPGNIASPEVSIRPLHIEPKRQPTIKWDKAEAIRSPRKSRRRASTHHHWQRKVEKEVALLEKAKHFVAKQKKQLKQRMAKLTQEKEWWRFEASQRRDPSWISEMKQLLEQHAELLATDARELKATEKWLNKRQSKLHQLERVCYMSYDDEDNEEDNDSIDATAERIHDELLQDGALMSEKLQSKSHPVVPWPSELPMNDRVYSRGYSPSMLEPPTTLFPTQFSHQRMYPTYTPFNYSVGSRVTEWASKREKASSAANSHRSYLNQLSKELQSYSNQTLSDGEINFS